MYEVLNKIFYFGHILIMLISDFIIILDFFFNKTQKKFMISI